MMENIHRRPASARGPEDDRVPEKYLGNQSELVVAWPGGRAHSLFMPRQI